MMTSKQMTHLSPEDQAKKALITVMERIRNHPEVGFYLGLGTQTFALVTEAAATLHGEPVEKIREFYAPRNPRNPYAEEAKP